MQCLVSCSVWYHAVSGITQCLVSCSVWCHAVSGITQCLVSYSVWCHAVSGVMQCLVSCSVWCHAVSGITQCLVSHSVWCHAVSGITQCLVSCSVWCHAVSGVMQCLVSHSVWCHAVSGVMQCLVSYSASVYPQVLPNIEKGIDHTDWYFAAGTTRPKLGRQIIWNEFFCLYKYDTSVHIYWCMNLKCWMTHISAIKNLQNIWHNLICLCRQGLFYARCHCEWIIY